LVPGFIRKINAKAKDKGMNLGYYVRRSARHWPNDIALICADKRLTFAEFEQRTNQLANGLRSLGLQKGDRVAVQSWNRFEIAEMEVACYKAGFVKVPVNARLSKTESIHVLNNSEAKAIILGPQHVQAAVEVEKQFKTIRHVITIEQKSDGKIDYEKLLAENHDEPPSVEVAPDDLAVLHYTSGTSGKLKAAMQTFENRLAAIRKFMMAPAILPGKDVRIALVGPITHATGMLLMPILFVGGCSIILDRFEVEQYLDTIQREKITHIFLVPTMINMILNHPKAQDYDLSSLKRVLYGAAPMSIARIRQAFEFFGPILVQGYGLGETTSIVTFLTAEEHIRGIGDNSGILASCGRPVFDTEVKVVDEKGVAVSSGEIGEIIIRGPDVMQGYWKEPELTRETLVDGWIHTGDMASVDQEGFIYIIDRKKDMIISGGFNVYPSEVEQSLYNHPSIYEVCVVGVPDEKWGEAVKAVVVLKEGGSATSEELIEHCSQSLATYKKPKTVDFVDELPKNPHGKIVRRLVQERYWADRKRRVH
jgi:acyl-CoA synthetase (AMP-forming)/AMP-acid ligase II